MVFSKVCNLESKNIIIFCYDNDTHHNCYPDDTKVQPKPNVCDFA